MPPRSIESTGTPTFLLLHAFDRMPHTLSPGPPVVKSLHKAVPEAFLDCHLCTVHPENYVADLAAAGGLDCGGAGFWWVDDAGER